MEQRIEMRGGGSLTFRQEGTKLQLEAERPEDGRGLSGGAEGASCCWEPSPRSGAACACGGACPWTRWSGRAAGRSSGRRRCWPSPSSRRTAGDGTGAVNSTPSASSLTRP